MPKGATGFAPLDWIAGLFGITGGPTAEEQFAQNIAQHGKDRAIRMDRIGFDLGTEGRYKFSKPAQEAVANLLMGRVRAGGGHMAGLQNQLASSLLGVELPGLKGVDIQPGQVPQYARPPKAKHEYIDQYYAEVLAPVFKGTPWEGQGHEFLHNLSRLPGMPVGRQLPSIDEWLRAGRGRN